MLKKEKSQAIIDQFMPTTNVEIAHKNFCREDIRSSPEHAST